jgi:transcriptional regulator with XRE-family HTH domain
MSKIISEASVRLGKRIRDLRTARELSQEQLAGMAELSAKYLGEVERGIGNISIERLNKIAGMLGVELQELLETGHKRSRTELLAEIASMAQKLPDKDVQIAYRMLRMLSGD